MLAQDKNCQKGAIAMAGIVKSHLYTMSSKTTNQVHVFLQFIVRKIYTLRCHEKIIKSIFWYDMHIFTQLNNWLNIITINQKVASCLHNKCNGWAECCLRYDDGTRNNSNSSLHWNKKSPRLYRYPVYLIFGKFINFPVIIFLIVTH